MPCADQGTGRLMISGCRRDHLHRPIGEWFLYVAFNNQDGDKDGGLMAPIFVWSDTGIQRDGPLHGMMCYLAQTYALLSYVNKHSA